MPPPPLISESSSLGKREVKDSVDYFCEHCEFKASTLNGIVQHTNDLHSSDLHPCDQCDYVALKSDNLKRHILHQHNLTRFNCDKCEKSFAEESTLKRHISIIHEMLLVEHDFDTCEFKESSPRDLFMHQNELHCAELHKCDQCLYVGLKAENLRRHKLRKHNLRMSVKPQYFCNMCDKSFGEEGNMKRHIKPIHDGQRYICFLFILHWLNIYSTLAYHLFYSMHSGPGCAVLNEVPRRSVIFCASWVFHKDGPRQFSTECVIPKSACGLVVTLCTVDGCQRKFLATLFDLI